MKDKKKIIICCALAIVIMVAGVTVGVLINKNKTKVPEVNTTTTTTVTTTESDKHVIGQNVDINETISNTTVEGGVAKGICTYKDTDYIALNDGIYTVNTQGKKQISSQKVGSAFSIIKDRIYYSVEGELEKIPTDCVEEIGIDEWQLYEGWSMNLDGSDKKKVIDFNGSGFIVYEDENTIYYAENPGPGLYTAGIGYNLCKYDIASGETDVIDRGARYYDTDAQGEVMYESVDSIFYFDGNIYYKNYSSDVSCTRAAVYNLKNDKVTEITEGCAQLYLGKNGTVYMNYGEEKKATDGGYCIDEMFLASYSIDTGEITKIKSFGDYAALKFNSDAENLYYAIDNYDEDDNITFSVYSCNSDNEIKEVVESQAGTVLAFTYNSALNRLKFITSKHNSQTGSSTTWVKQLENGVEKSSGEYVDGGWCLSACGRYAAVLDANDSEGNFLNYEMVVFGDL